MNKLTIMLIICFQMINISIFINPLDLKAQGYKQIKIQTEIETVAYSSDIFAIDKYIKLETRPDNLINYIFSLRFRNDTVFAFSNKKVFMWSLGGKYLGAIGQLGNGPEEMILPSDFALSPGGGKLGIWDNVRQTLYLYNPDGRLVEKVKPGFVSITNFTWTDSNQLIFNSEYIQQKNKHFAFYITDLQGRQLAELLPLDPIGMGLGFLNYSYFPTFRNKQYIWMDLNQVIYEVTPNNTLTPAFNIEFDQGNFSQEDLKKFRGDTYKLVDYLMKNDYCQLFSFNELTDFYAITYLKGKKHNTNIISKNGEKQFRIQHAPETLDPIGGVLPIFPYKDGLVGVLEPYILKSKLKQMLPPVKKQLGKTGTLLEKMAGEVKEDDNPILIFFKIKAL